ncbi:MAG: site-2 protease family protein [Clostridia bacterium]|nr:site-2 protease family protein [Clostridia bacterium]
MFLALVLIHEFGHFIAAKAMGVRVNEFAIGFGPKLVKWRWGETEYKINLIPFGGYCAMEGEDEESADSRAFCNKKAWRRAIIIVAGAFFNLLLGFLIIGGTLLPQERFLTTKVGEFYPEAVSEQNGLAIGDEIVAVDGRKVFSTVDLSYMFTGVDDGALDITVIRDGKKVTLENVKFVTEEIDGIDYVTIDFKVYGQKKTVGSFISQTFKTGLSYGRVVWFSLIDLLTGKYGISAVSGPVGVTAAIGSAAKQSLANLWPIMALITINLGIFNLLPIPALDGGRLLFIILEMIFRKKIPEKYESWIHAAGFALLILVMVLITAKDIIALVV